MIEERERLGLSQAAFYKACGVTKKAQYNFENDHNLPGGAYLIAADKLGVDVLYVLTGRRSVPVSTKEAALLGNYRALDEDGKAVLDKAGDEATKQGAAVTSAGSKSGKKSA